MKKTSDFSTEVADLITSGTLHLFPHQSARDEFRALLHRRIVPGIIEQIVAEVHSQQERRSAMKTIHVLAVDPSDRGARDSEVLVSRIVGWCSRGRRYSNRNFTDYDGPTTLVTLDSGAEYEIAESVDDFRARLAAAMDQ